jgi:hypothetical protein
LRKRGRGRDTERRSETEDDHGNAVHGRMANGPTVKVSG